MSMLRRRTVLQAGGAAAAAALTGIWSGLMADDFKEHPYIDAHSHVWSPDTERWPLANNKTKADLDPPSFTPAELFELALPEKIKRVVLIQHHLYHGWDNTYLTDCARTYAGNFAVVGMIDDQKGNVIPQMDALLKKRVTGFRITPWIYKEKWLASDGMHEMWKHAAETGQAMCCLIDAKDIEDVDRMCAANPQTTVVIDHFARIGVDGMIRDEDVSKLCGLAKHKKVHLKLSAYYALGKKTAPYLDLVPMIRRALDAFGTERCMWASDAPYQVQPPHTYKASIELIRNRLEGLSAGDKETLLRKTAEKVFFGVRG